MKGVVTEQLELQGISDARAKKPTWGGARARAGRPRLANPGYVRHQRRPRHAKSRPVHITMRARRGLPSFRAQLILQMMMKVLRIQRSELAKVKRKYGDVFRVHIAFARQLAKLFGRKKLKVWAERFHSREVGSPQDVVNTLQYIFQNFKKHGGAVTHGCGLVDRFSSARQFDGWDAKTKFEDALYGVPLDETFNLHGPEPWAPALPPVHVHVPDLASPQEGNALRPPTTAPDPDHGPRPRPRPRP